MASSSRVPSISPVHLPAYLILVALLFISSADAQQTSPFPFGPQKQAHIHFFFHEIVGGSNPTTIQIVSPAGNDASGFGRVAMADNALTETADPSSKLLGRAQGMYASASQSEPALLMNMNFVFSDGDFNGSSLAVMGRNPFQQSVRELTVVGGSGALRMARGYALARTNSTTNNRGAVVEYDVYVLYYQNTGSG